MLGDKAYDSAELREELDERQTKPVIPNRCNRKQPFSFSKRLYRLRWRIENAFNRLKDFRRIATRYDRLALNYLASVCLAAALVWWICNQSRPSSSPRSASGGGAGGQSVTGPWQFASAASSCVRRAALLNVGLLMRFGAPPVNPPAAR